MKDDWKRPRHYGRIWRNGPTYLSVKNGALKRPEWVKTGRPVDEQNVR